MEITLQDIANELDVSAMTVSRSLRHDGAIAPETRARVNETARRLGYKARVRRPRRVEATTETQILGLLVRHSSLDRVQHDTTLMKMMAGMMAVGDENGLHLKVHSLPARESRHLDEEVSLLPPMIAEGTCRALIAQGDQDERDLGFLANRLPVVSIGRTYRNLPIDSAVADNIEGVRELVGHLVGLGHRRLAWVGAFYNSTFVEDRKTGFVKGCLTHDLELHQHSFFGPEIYRKPDIHDHQALVAAARAGVTAFVCGNDNIALQVMKILEAAGQRVPDDVSVTGFDAAPATYGHLRLTSVDPHFFEIGRAAARLALQRSLHPLSQPASMSVRGKIVVGDTTSLANRAADSAR